MRLQYKHQKFQADAAQAVVDVFAGQPYRVPSYRMDRGGGTYQLHTEEERDFTGFANHKIVLSDGQILAQLRKVQRAGRLRPSERLEGRESGYHLTIEMETGVGKTYTYIKTMFELNRRYGWSKFIVVAPSVAIREGVYQSFSMTREHFAEEYGKKIRFFIYDSARLTEIDRFASDSAIHVMIINAQAFNAKGRDARRIYMKLGEFRSRRPIDIIARTNPILIIDEPQSVEGRQTKERLKEFCPLLTLRYSATHRSDSMYNMVYRLDAMDAYNRRLVKKIAVKGIAASGSTATDGFLYLESVNLSQSDPTATLQFEVKAAVGAPRKKRRIVKIGDNLYDASGGLEEYKDGFVVRQIDGRDDSVSFLNGVRIRAGDVIGAVDEEQLRRIQIRETILSHIERERRLFYQGIKVLSLFFIDEVANYRAYDAAGQKTPGRYAALFEEEYENVVGQLAFEPGEEAYRAYLRAVPAAKTHDGYFSVDGKGKLVNSKVKRRETTSDDASAYELIMKNKERLLDLDPSRSPVRFIFSHSALREGWDNPNVFQICTLKQSGSDIRKRQEVGRGLRLCVNQSGERMDAAALGEDVHTVNVLTVIASESYDDFARGLQTEMAEAIADRLRAVTPDLFIGRVITDERGGEQVVDFATANVICYDMFANGYIDRQGALTDAYYEAKASGTVKVAEPVADAAASVLAIVDSVYDARGMMPENARAGNVTPRVDERRLAMPEFQALWAKINAKSVYAVEFDTDELIRKASASLNQNLRVSKIYFQVETGSMQTVNSKEALLSGASMVKEASARYGARTAANGHVKYDLIGKLVDETGLTRKAVAAILQSIRPEVFGQFRENPEEFIVKAAALINDEKASVVVEHITYHMFDDRYGTEIFTEPALRGKLNVNAMKAKKHLYDHVVYDSGMERDFAEALETHTDVAVYVKLPGGFYITTPVGRYHPDWAIAFYKGKVKHIYFVAETKGSMSSLQLREIEKSKIHCAREHFKAISGEAVVYDVVDSYQALLDKVMR